jgi:hypothetical protein
MGNSHKNLLLRNRRANCNQTFVEWSLDGPLPKMCPVIPTSNQDGHQAKNRKKGGMKLKKNLLFWNYWANLNQTLLKWSLGGPLSKLCPSVPSCIQNGQNCSILSQKVPKFELYNHNDELFNIYYRIFYELWTFAYFDRLCKLEKRGDEIKKKSSPLKLLSQSQPNFAEMILGWSPFKIVSVSAILYPKWPKLLYFKPESAQIWTV